MAHELCHHVKNHIWQAIALQSVPRSRRLMSCIPSSRHSPDILVSGMLSDIANLPLFALAITFLSLLILPGVKLFLKKDSRLRQTSTPWTPQATHWLSFPAWKSWRS